MVYREDWWEKEEGREMRRRGIRVMEGKEEAGRHGQWKESQGRLFVERTGGRRREAGIGGGEGEG